MSLGSQTLLFTCPAWRLLLSVPPPPLSSTFHPALSSQPSCLTWLKHLGISQGFRVIKLGSLPIRHFQARVPPPRDALPPDYHPVASWQRLPSLHPLPFFAAVSDCSLRVKHTQLTLCWSQLGLHSKKTQTLFAKLWMNSRPSFHLKSFILSFRCTGNRGWWFWDAVSLAGF